MICQISFKVVIDKQGVYNDEEGDLVTSIAGGKDCTPRYENGCCLCALELFPP